MIPISDDVRIRNTSWATWTIIGINTIILAFTIIVPDWILERFFMYYGAIPARLTNSFWAWYNGYPSRGWITLLTSLFLHGGIFHWLANMWSLGIFGPRVEDRIGSFNFLILYLLSGVGAGLTHVVFFPNSTIPVVGASGAVAGVMGAYLLLYPTAWITLAVPFMFFPWFIRIPAVLFLPMWYIGELLSGMISLAAPGYSNIAFMAHVGGFLTGMLLLSLMDGLIRSNNDAELSNTISFKNLFDYDLFSRGCPVRQQVADRKFSRKVIPEEIIHRGRRIKLNLHDNFLFQ